MGLEEPSSEDDDEEAEEGGMLADIDDSGEDSDASPEGARASPNAPGWALQASGLKASAIQGFSLKRRALSP